MILKFYPQANLFDRFAKHEIGQHLKVIAQWLNEHPEILELASKDLIRVESKAAGRYGLSVEAVIRCGILKQYHQWSYQELSFHLEDSESCRAFARLDGRCPKKSALQKTITLIRCETWEAINRILLRKAEKKKIEKGQQIRIDSTATATDIHPPTDSGLLSDSVRVMVRLLGSAQDLSKSMKIQFSNRHRRAKKLARYIATAKEKKRKEYYRDLVKITKEEFNYLKRANDQIKIAGVSSIAIEGWLALVKEYEPLIQGIIEQAERRIFKGECVPVEDKIFSLFEPHTDIIAKGNRKTIFGHKLNLTSGHSGLILDVVIEEGNPADSQRCIPMLERQKEIYGKYPEKAAMDGGYASKENLTLTKSLGSKQVMFHKKRGLREEEMTSSLWMYRQLKKFRSGIESNISCLKRAYGLSRCLWKGFEKFKSYIWSSVVAYNLALLAQPKYQSS
jgi:transposase, IS5 family